MKLVKTKHAGFCFGVSRAVGLALDLRSKDVEPIYTLGWLIHNRQEVERLQGLGIEPKENIDDCVGGTTIIRTHGISKAESERAEALGVDLVDAICPHVKVVKRHIRAFERQSRTTLIVGDRDHPEVKALLSYAGGDVHVVSPLSGIPDLDPDTPIGVVAQTTQNKETFDSVVDLCRDKFKDLLVLCTICDDAVERQREAREIASQVDLMLVVGGSNSANTKRLASACQAILARTHHLEKAEELSGLDWEGVETIGLTSGASTPDWIVEKVENWIETRFG
jgi:4-hydroxy-3-methylbut-2-en-1-yl diphosphate reductase